MIRLSSRPVSFYALAIMATFVGVLRALFEYQFFGAKITVQILWFMPYFYFSIGLVLFALFRYVANLDWKRCFGAVMMGVALGVFPPLIDVLTYGIGARVSYSYNFFADWSQYPWLFYAGPESIPAGECASLWASVVFGGIYVFLATRSLIRSILFSIALFLFFHIYLSGIPIITAAMVFGQFVSSSARDLPSGHVINAVTFLFAFWYVGIAFVAYATLRPVLIKKFIRRVLHILPFTLIALLGSLLARQPGSESVLNAICLSFIFYVAAVENDYYDALHEQIQSGVNRQDISFLRMAVIMIILWLAFLGQIIGILYLLIYLASIIYHMPQYRARRYFAAGMKIEGVWGWLAFTSGTLVKPAGVPDGALVIYSLMAFLGWSLLSVLKDLKDLRRDKKSGSESLYLFLRRHGWRISRSHQVLVWIIFASLLVPALYLASRDFMLHAALLLVANIALLIVNKRRRFFGNFYWQLVPINLYLLVLLTGHGALSR